MICFHKRDGRYLLRGKFWDFIYKWLLFIPKKVVKSNNRIVLSRHFSVFPWFFLVLSRVQRWGTTRLSRSITAALPSACPLSPISVRTPESPPTKVCPHRFKLIELDAWYAHSWLNSDGNPLAQALPQLRFEVSLIGPSDAVKRNMTKKHLVVWLVGRFFILEYLTFIWTKLNTEKRQKQKHFKGRMQSVM